MAIADSGESGSSKLYTSPRKEKRWSSYSIAAAYVKSMSDLDLY
jgi:phosphatidylinositol glycan class U